MPFEAFLGFLKAFCENSNYKTVPFTVMQKWAMSRRYMQRNRGTRDILSVDIIASSLPIPASILFASPPPASLLLSRIVQSPDHIGMLSARHLTYIARDGVEIRVGEWVLVSTQLDHRVARVQEMAEVSFHDMTLIRILCSDSCGGVCEDVDAVLRVSKDRCTSSLMVRLESVSVVALAVLDRGDHREFRYVL